MGKINSNQKGKRGERELANLLNKLFNIDTCRRSQQFCGSNGDADVIGIDGIHSEVKRVESLNIGKAMAQAVSDCRDEDVPVVHHRKNGGDWLTTVRTEDLPELAQCLFLVIYGESDENE